MVRRCHCRTPMAKKGRSLPRIIARRLSLNRKASSCSICTEIISICRRSGPKGTTRDVNCPRAAVKLKMRSSRKGTTWWCWPACSERDSRIARSARRGDTSQTGVAEHGPQGNPRRPPFGFPLALEDQERTEDYAVVSSHLRNGNHKRQPTIIRSAFTHFRIPQKNRNNSESSGGARTRAISQLPAPGLCRDARTVSAIALKCSWEL